MLSGNRISIKQVAQPRIADIRKLASKIVGNKIQKILRVHIVEVALVLYRNHVVVTDNQYMGILAQRPKRYILKLGIFDQRRKKVK
jgi:hypothetical protein